MNKRKPSARKEEVGDKTTNAVEREFGIVVEETIEVHKTTHQRHTSLPACRNDEL
jgi:hypothetical protein